MFQRDSYTCQDCKKCGLYIEAHHIASIKELLKKYDIKDHSETIKISEFWNIDNGVTLCRECHMIRHNKKIKQQIK